MSVMARKPPKIEYVKHVLAKGKWYSYFLTGQAENGKPIMTRLPGFGSVGFWDSYASCKAGRARRQEEAWTVSALAAEYLASPEYARKAKNTQSSYAIAIKKIVATWGNFPVNELHPAFVRAAVEKETWGAGTRNIVVGTLGILYRWARRQSRTESDPVKDIERLKTGEHDPWPDHVLDSALQAEDDQVRLAVHLLYFTGQRIGDVCAMRWSDIRDGHIYVRQTKTGKLVEPPLTAELRAELDRTPKTGLLILPDPHPGRLRRRLQSFTVGLGHKTVPHGLRKNAVNALLEAGCTIAEVAAITGQTHQVVEHYAAKVNRRKLGKAAIVKLEAARNRR